MAERTETMGLDGTCKEEMKIFNIQFSMLNVQLSYLNSKLPTQNFKLLNPQTFKLLSPPVENLHGITSL